MRQRMTRVFSRDESRRIGGFFGGLFLLVRAAFSFRLVVFLLNFEPVGQHDGTSRDRLGSKMEPAREGVERRFRELTILRFV
jgi:hypothetical protein